MRSHFANQSWMLLVLDSPSQDPGQAEKDHECCSSALSGKAKQYRPGCAHADIRRSKRGEEKGGLSLARAGLSNYLYRLYCIRL